MLYDPKRHEPLSAEAWDEQRAHACIAHIVRDIETSYSPQSLWRTHSQDAEPSDDPAKAFTPLYFGAAGVVWAHDYLRAIGAAPPSPSLPVDLEDLITRNGAWLATFGSKDFGSYMMGDLPILMMAYARAPTPALADRIADLIAGNIDHPARELMWGSPGSLLAALFMHRHSADPRWADLFRTIAAKLETQLIWSEQYACHYWTQDMYGQHSTYIDAVHGFVATAAVLIRGRDLLAPEAWQKWQATIVNTVQRTATIENGLANWRAILDVPALASINWLMQFCHGSPGFVICLAPLQTPDLDELLLMAGEATWAAGPLAKGSNLCHGTGGNGYAFLYLYARAKDQRWLDRARAFAMHGIAQTDEAGKRHGQMRYSLWTGDPGFAVYLWDCIRAEPTFPTLDAFFV